MVAFAANAPQCVGAEVAHTEPDDPEPLPLADVDQFVPQQVRRLGAGANDDQGAQGDPRSATGYRAADPQPVSIAAFDRHREILTQPRAAPQRRGGNGRSLRTAVR